MTTPPVPIPVAGTEVEHLLGTLDRQRTTFRWKADGLDAAGLAATIGASSMTLGGLLKHLALVEAHYFTARLLGVSPGPPWEDVDWDAEPDWEWTSAVDDSPEQLYALYDAAVARSRANLGAAVESGGLDQLLDLGWSGEDKPSLRRMVCDLIEEYGRHTGHADLLREAVDGRVGEDPPPDFAV
ncbi:DinB family protein [soil metagenome]